MEHSVGMFAACSFSIALSESPFYKEEEIQSFCVKIRDPKSRDYDHRPATTKAYEQETIRSDNDAQSTIVTFWHAVFCMD